MRGRIFLLSSAFILLVLTTSANAYRPVIDLGDGTAYSINDNGLIVGQSGSRACIFDSTGHGANTDLGTLAGFNSSRARSINNSGQIVGRAENNPPATPRACLFDNTGAGANKDLGTIIGDLSDAWSINNKGNIVGESSASGGQRACLYTTKPDPWTGKPVPVVIDLGTFGGIEPINTRSIAYSINSNDHIVGDVIYSYSEYHACLFDSTGNKTNKNLGNLGGTQSRAFSINDSDKIVGWADSSDYSHACLFDKTGGGANIDLGIIPGRDLSSAHFINNLDQIVGVVAVPFVGISSYRACLFDSLGQGNNIDINTLIDLSSGWTLNIAYCINNSGWIVGSMTNAAGDTHAFLLTPEPASLLLLFLGGFFASRRNRR